MAPRWPRYAALTLRLALLAAAVWALRRELDGNAPRELAAHLASYGPRYLALGLACTVASFLLLGVIEIVALRHAGPASARPGGPVEVPGALAMSTAFVANALSQSVGVALLTGAAVRMRAYGRRGVDAVTVARVTAFATLTTTLGLVATGAVALLTTSAPLHVRGLSIPTRPLGAALALLVCAYLAWGALGSGDARGVGRGRWRLARPSIGLAVAQVGLSALDWLLTGTVLFAFVPAALGLGFWTVMRAYAIAQTVGVASHVPGGAGVLEVALLALLVGTGSAARVAILASLVMFRVVYYLAPLLAAMAVAGASELRRTMHDNRALEAAHAG